jgi:hypothetical protein
LENIAMYDWQWVLPQQPLLVGLRLFWKIFLTTSFMKLSIGIAIVSLSWEGHLKIIDFVLKCQEENRSP